MTETQSNAARRVLLVQKRLDKAMQVSLAKGAHKSLSQGACVMELVAYVAGEKWSDAPQCACPVISAFMVSWNDALAEEPRNRLLKPLIPLLVGTRSTKQVEKRRSYMALDWLIRVFTPKWLDMVPSLHEHAKALRELDAVMDMVGATASGKRVAAAGDAAWDAERAAARAVAWDALKPTSEFLQTSAAELVRQMIAVETT